MAGADKYWWHAEWGEAVHGRAVSNPQYDFMPLARFYLRDPDYVYAAGVRWPDSSCTLQWFSGHHQFAQVTFADLDELLQSAWAKSLHFYWTDVPTDPADINWTELILPQYYPAP